MPASEEGAPRPAFAAAGPGLVDLVLPRRCAGCRSPGTGWCAGCARELGGLRAVRGALPAGAEPVPPVFALGAYRAAARRAVLAYKIGGRRDLADPLGRALADGVAGLGDWGIGSEPEGAWHLVPAPSRALASRRRGGAHMTRVARRAAAELARRGIAAEVADCLVASGTRDSVGLDAAERLANLAGRLAVRSRRSPPPGARVLLVDDVLTTGATALSSLRALTGRGLATAAVLVLTTAAGQVPARAPPIPASGRNSNHPLVRSGGMSGRQNSAPGACTGVNFRDRSWQHVATTRHDSAEGVKRVTWDTPWRGPSSPSRVARLAVHITLSGGLTSPVPGAVSRWRS
ncbi:ComF family protein [Saccharopolyspora sp. MS10]|uniref:ComF family protein n=1 Tax=Saccharopolyspora sp. MS10 TaxID=3385973 RepID=UPI0039A3F273